MQPVLRSVSECSQGTPIKKFEIFKRTTIRLMAVFLVFTLLVFSVNLKAQVANYSFSQTAGTYANQATAGLTSLVTTTWDDDGALATVSFPFSFTFKGVAYTTANVSTNGFISFGSTTPADDTYTPISGAEGYSGAISALGKDIASKNATAGTNCAWNSGSPTITGVTTAPPIGTILTGSTTGIPAGATVIATTATTITMNVNATISRTGRTVTYYSGILTQTTGTSPNRKFYIQWSWADSYNGSTRNGSTLNFQIVLNESTNIINIIYGAIAPNTTTNPAPQVGLRGSANTDFNNRTGSTWSASTAGVANNAAMTLTNAALPNSGQTYTFSPPLPPPTLTAASGATVDAPFNITFTDNSTWRAAITSITVNGTTLSASAYSTTTAGQITFTPSASVLLQTPGSKTIVVTATGFTTATITQNIGAGVGAKLVMNGQPTAPVINGGVLATQPSVFIQDQYSNATTSTASITATPTGGTWSIGGGTNPISAVNGTATFSGLTATSPAPVPAATITFSGTGLTSVVSNSFNIPGAPPTLIAAAGATVDAPFNVNFSPDNSPWRGAITGITVNGTALSATAYSTTTAGQITFTPSASVLLQTPGSKTIVVSATNYPTTSVTQTIGAGVANKLVINIQPTSPAANGGVLATQPSIFIRDQYGNATTSNASITATPTGGTWTIGGGTNPVAGVNGTATFSGLTATSAAPVSAATITFSGTGLTSVVSNSFNIPGAPPTLIAAVGATVDAPFNVTFSPDNSPWRTAIAGITVNGTALSATAYSTSTAGQITFTPSASALLQSSGSKTIVVSATNYPTASVIQNIGSGAPARLVISVQPTAPPANTGVLATQPSIFVRDQYGNATISTASITAAPSNATWTLGGTTTIAATNGAATFSGLTATVTSNTAVTATITFTSGTLTLVVSNSFIIPAPTYKSLINSISFGTSPWCVGETRSVTVSVTNTGNATWTDASPDINIGLKWDSDPDFGSAPGNIGRQDAGNLAPGATRTYTFPIVTPVLSSGGVDHLTADVVEEAISWFRDNNGGVGPGNLKFVTPDITISRLPSITSVTASPTVICSGNSSNLIVTAPTLSAITIVNYDFNSGSSYATLVPELASGITSAVSSTEIFNNTFAGIATGGGAFTNNTGNTSPFPTDLAIGTTNSSGSNSKSFVFTLTGSNLSKYKTFKIYFQAQRSTTGAQAVNVVYSLNGGSFVNTGESPITMSPGNGSFNEATITLPSSVDNPATSLAFGLALSGASGSGSLRIDNFEVQAVPVITYSWIGSPSGTAGLPGTAGSALTTNNNISVSPTATTNYIVTATNANGGGCSVTGNVNVTVNPTSIAGGIGGAGTVCSGTNSTTLTLSGNTGTIQWQSSPNNTTFNNISGATSSTYTATNLTATTYYRAVVTSGVCASATTLSVTVIVNPTSVAGSISGAATVCSGTNSTTLTLSGNTGTIQWQSSTDNTTFNNISGAISSTYTAANLTATTYYRAVVTSGVCASATTLSVTVIVNPTSVAGSIGGAATVCSGTNSTTLTLSGNTGTIQWQSSTDNTTFNNISGAISSTYTAANLTATTYYRAVVTSGVCASATTLSVTVIVNPTSVAGSIGGAATVCSGTNSTTLTLSGNTGTIQWQSSPDNTTFTNISGANASTYTAANLTATTYYRAVVTSGVCASATTSTVTITVTTQPAATISYPGTPYCSNVGSTSVTQTGTGGGTYSSTAGLSINSTNGTVDIGASTPGTYIVTYTVAASGGCSIYTTTTSITINANTWQGVNTDWSDVNNWSCGTVPTSINNVVIPPGGNQPVLAASSSYGVHNLSIASGAILTLNQSGTDTAVLTITGSYANSGTLANNGKLILNGDVAQSFPGSSAIVTAMNALEVNNSNGVTIDKSFTLTGVLTPTAGTIALGNNYITLKSDVTNTARVGVVGATTPFSYSTGRFVVQRYINSNRAWRLMTAPISASSSIYNGWQLGGVTTVTSPSVAGQGEYVTGSGATSANGLDAGVSGNYSLKIYNTTTGALDGVTNTKTAAISPGYPGSSASNVGYFNFIRGDRTPSNIDPLQTNSTLTTLSDTGKLQTGSYTFPAIPTQNKYSLIGNPYASPVYFPDITFTNVARRFYAWDPQINQVGAYVIADDQDGDGKWSYNIDTALTPQRLDIQSSQAVFVQTILNGPASLTFNESNKSGKDVGLLFRPTRSSAAITSFRTNLFLLNANNSVAVADGVFAQFSTDFSNGVDVQDGVKFPNVNETFSLIRNGALLSLERRQPITATDTLFFSLTRSSQRAYQFQFKTDGLYQAGVSAFLEDSYLNTSTAIDLSVASTINFTITADAASQAANRFRVVFKPSAGGPLPVTFTSVKAYQQNSAINVSWKVENEMNIKEYQVEKSTDGIHFGNAVTIKATGNNGSTANYQWPDANPVAGNNYYRITSVDINGKAEHSNIVKVFTGRGKAGLMVYPNPVVDGNINLQLVNQPGGRYSIRLLNKLGQEIMAKQIEHEEGSSTQTLKISKTIAHGTYQLEITKPDFSKSIINVLK